MDTETIAIQNPVDPLPYHLAERTWLRTSGRSVRDGEHALYWTHDALRADENLDLDIARLMTEKLELLLLMYQDFSEKYRFAAERHQTLVLESEQPILVSLRPRTVALHVFGTNIEANERIADRAVARSSPRIAMIETGFAGRMCSRILFDQGLWINCFEKSYRGGGRASPRIADGINQFDPGVQYFPLRDPVLQPFIKSWCTDVHVAEWLGHVVSIDASGVFRDVTLISHFVVTPKMESLREHLAMDQLIDLETEVSQVERRHSGHGLTSKTERDLGAFDIVLWNHPPEQVRNLLSTQCDWRLELTNVEIVPCWSDMLAFEERWRVLFECATIKCDSLGWIARDSSKPLRCPILYTWVLPSTVAWAQ